MFTPVLAKHTKSFNLIDTLSVGVDRIQRNFARIQEVSLAFGAHWLEKNGSQVNI
jgi:hypothetical protein